VLREPRNVTVSQVRVSWLVSELESARAILERVSVKPRRNIVCRRAFLVEVDVLSSCLSRGVRRKETRHTPQPRHQLFLRHPVLTRPQLFASSMGEFLAAAAALLQDLTQTIEATKHSMVSECFGFYLTLNSSFFRLNQ
jgi:hypothetical protein